MQVQPWLTRLLSLQLVKTAELDPSRNYLAGFHPQGIMAPGAFVNLCTESTGFSSLFPGIRPHLIMLPFWFRVPFFREYLMMGGESSQPWVAQENGAGGTGVGFWGGGLLCTSCKSMCSKRRRLDPRKHFPQHCAGPVSSVRRRGRGRGLSSSTQRSPSWSGWGMGPRPLWAPLVISSLGHKHPHDPCPSPHT